METNLEHIFIHESVSMTRGYLTETRFCFHYKTDYGNIVPCTMDKTEIEVIGNKFENPELLKECE